MALVTTNRSAETALSGATTHNFVLSAAVLAGDLLYVCIAGTTSETFTITAISDTINGNWNIGSNPNAKVSAAADDAGGTGRIYCGILLNSAAGAASTITVTTSAAQAGFGIAGALSGPEAARFEFYAVPTIQGTLVTPHPSPVVPSISLTGAVFGMFWCNAARTTTASVGTKITTGSTRWHLWYQIYSSNADHSVTLTTSTTARSIFNFVTLATAKGIKTVTVGDNSTNTFSGTEDTYLRQNPDPTLNFGNDGNILIAKESAIENFFTLIRFTGLSNIPAGVTITAAKLFIYLNDGDSGDQLGEMRRMLTDWTETGATWNTKNGSTAWNSGGAQGALDVSSTQSAISGPINAPDYRYHSFSGAQLITDIQNIIDGVNPNYGWHLRETTGIAGFWLDFFSSEGTNLFRPYLEITYTDPVVDLTIGDNTGNDQTGFTVTEIKWNDPTANFNSNVSFEMTKWAAGTHSHALMRISAAALATIPAGATIISATIYIRHLGGTVGTRTIDLRRLLRVWNLIQATWNVWATASNWGTAGALNATDRSSTISASATLATTVTLNTFVTWSAAQLVADVQAFVAGTITDLTYHGEDSGGPDSQFRSFVSEEGANGFRPYIRITYTLGAVVAFTDMTRAVFPDIHFSKIKVVSY